MEKNNGSEKIIYPSTYRDEIAFAYVCCKGCVYEKDSLENASNRVEKCLTCLNEKNSIFDHYRHKREQPVIIIKDEIGKNILEPVKDETGKNLLETLTVK